jgi:hypothetical protein
VHNFRQEKDLEANHDALQAGKQKEVHHTPLIWHPQAPDQGSTINLFLFPRLKSIMKGAHFADMAAIQERDSGSAIDY